MLTVQHFSLRARILAGFLLSAAASLSALGYALGQLQAIGDGLVVIEAGYLPLSRVATQLEALQSQAELDVTALAGAGRLPFDLRELTAEKARRVEQLLDDGSLIVHEVQPGTREPEEIAVLGFIDRQLQLISELHSQQASDTALYLGWVEGGELARAEAMEPELAESGAQLEVEVSLLSRRINDSISRVSARTSAAQTRALAAGAALGSAALVFGAVMLALVGLALRPIGRVIQEVQRISRGDYGARIEVERRDELGLLAEEVNAMARSIQQRGDDLRSRALELEEARGRLRSVLDAIHLGLVVVSEGRIEMCNPAAQALWGVTPGSALPAPLSLSADRVEALSIGERSFDLGRVPFGRGFILVGEEVTQRLRDRELLLRSERLALVGQMLAQVTHEVRNPLNAMSLNAELLQEELAYLPDSRQDDAREILGILTSEITRLEAVTEHYLDLARRPRPLILPQDLAELVQEVGRLVEEELRRSGIALSVEAPDIGHVPADGNQLRQALLNVLRNAAEAGATRIEVRLSRGEGGVRIEVTDDGQGMDAETAERALDPFFSTKAQGSGLGLAITRQILEEQGGSIELEPQVVGTRVAMVLPASM